jgi:hypothetical protein
MNPPELEKTSRSWIYWWTELGFGAVMFWGFLVLPLVYFAIDAPEKAAPWPLIGTMLVAAGLNYMGFSSGRDHGQGEWMKLAESNGWRPPERE